MMANDSGACAWSSSNGQSFHPVHSVQMMQQQVVNQNEQPTVYVQQPCMYSTYQTVIQSEPQMMVGFQGQFQNSRHRLSDVHQFQGESLFGEFRQVSQDSLQNMHYQTQCTTVRIPQMTQAPAAAPAPLLRQRMSYRPPSPPPIVPEPPAWQQKLAKLVHGLLYVLMLAMPLIIISLVG